jgi:hypothetical protein
MASKLLRVKEDANNPKNRQRFRDLEEPDWEGEGMKSRMLSLKGAANKLDEPCWKDRLFMWHARDASIVGDDLRANIGLSLDAHDAGIVQEGDPGADIDISSLDAQKDNSDDGNEDYVISQFTEAWNFLIEGVAYQWLLGKIQAQLVLNKIVLL